MKIVNERLLDAFRGPGLCEFCGKKKASRDAAHVFSRGAGRVDVRCNLLSLCRLCHSLTEKNPKHKTQLLVIVSLREKIGIEDIEPVVMFIRNQLDKHDSIEKQLIKAKTSALTDNQKAIAMSCLLNWTPINQKAWDNYWRDFQVFSG